MSSPIYTDRDDLAVLAWIAANPGASETETKLLIPHVRAMVDLAVRELSIQVWDSGEDRQRMFKDFTVTVSGTTGGAVATLDPTLIPDSINPEFGGSVFSSVIQGKGLTGYLDWRMDLADASIAHNFECIGTFTVKGGDGAVGKIYCFDYTGEGGILSGSQVTVKGAIHYDFATVPEYYKARLVKILVQMAREKMAGITQVRQTLPAPGGNPNG